MSTDNDGVYNSRAESDAMDSSKPPRRNSSGYPHAVKFYIDEGSLGRTVADFLVPALNERLPALVIATPAHRTLIADELARRDVNVRRLEDDGDLQMLDAEQTLALFMAGNEPDRVRFEATVNGLIERACKGRRDCPVRAYGEMVDVLWKRGTTDAAIRLEILWNRIATDAKFSLLCGYAVGSFYKQIASNPTFQTVCDQHNHIIPAGKTA